MRPAEALAVTVVVRKLVGAWNRGDADAFGRAFARSVRYVTGAGRLVRGRAAIARLVTRSGGKVRIVGEVEVRRRGAAALARFGWCSTSPRGSARSGTIACTLAREGGAWLIHRLTDEERPVTRAGRGKARELS